MDDSQAGTRMNILAIETSQPKASLCLSGNDGSIRFSSHWEAQRNHDAFLFPALQKALDCLGNEPLSHILVGAGPGSYGGVRVALAAAAGISTVKDARVAAVGSWDALAQDKACIVSDARRGGWTLRRPSGQILVLTLEELQQEALNGALLYSIESEERMQQIGVQVARAGLCPAAEGLVQTWLALSPAERAAYEAHTPEPIYVRPPHITEPKHKPWEIHA